MTLTTYGLYLAAVALLILTPGPTMLMSITNAASFGTGRALVSTAGSVTAVLGVMLLSSTIWHQEKAGSAKSPRARRRNGRIKASGKSAGR